MSARAANGLRSQSKRRRFPPSGNLSAVREDSALHGERRAQDSAQRDKAQGGRGGLARPKAEDLPPTD